MNPHRTADPDAPVVVLFPPFGGSPAVYAELVRDVGADYQVIGLQSYGLLDPDHPDTTVEQMGERYSRDLLDHRPLRACLLVGYSMGGVLAVETARHLAAARVEPMRVLLVDSKPTHPELADCDPFTTLLTEVLHVELDLSGFDALDQDERLLRIRDAAAEQGKLAKRFPLARLAKLAGVCAANQAAAARFEPRFHPGPLHSIQAIPPEAGSPGHEPWSAYATEVETEYLTAGHYDALSHPAARIVSDAATRLLDEQLKGR